MAENITSQIVFSLCQEKGLTDLWQRLCAAARVLFYANAERGLVLASNQSISQKTRQECDDANREFVKARTELEQKLDLKLEGISPTCIYNTCREVS